MFNFDNFFFLPLMPSCADRRVGPFAFALCLHTLPVSSSMAGLTSVAGRAPEPNMSCPPTRGGVHPFRQGMLHSLSPGDRGGVIHPSLSPTCTCSCLFFLTPVLWFHSSGSRSSCPFSLPALVAGCDRGVGLRLRRCLGLQQAFTQRCAFLCRASLCAKWIRRLS